MPCQFEQGDRRLAPILLNMNERAGKLNKSFKKQVVRLTPLWQPQFFEDLVRLEEELLVKTMKISQIMRVKLPTFERLNDGSDFPAFMAHELHHTAPGSLSKDRNATSMSARRVDSFVPNIVANFIERMAKSGKVLGKVCDKVFGLGAFGTNSN
jgi:hypothetical protein